LDSVVKGGLKPEILIGERKVGPDHPPLVMAEVGINHEGDLVKAMQCVEAAVEAGAECIKFQCHITEAEMIPTDMKPGEISDERLWDIIKRCELTEEEERRVKLLCDKKGILYLSTPFSREAADRLHSFGVPAFKIGSGECNNLPLIKHIARWRKPVILSTGMNDIPSIAPSVDVLEGNGCPFMVMHCTSMYPTPYEHVRLNAVPELAEAFGVPVGLSDHSIGIYTCLGAVAVGACVLEKHFTVSRSWPGPDVPISIEPNELGELVRGSRAVWRARGGHKTVLDEEQPVIDFAFASVVTIRPIKRGEKFSLANTWVKRPGTGPIHARDLDKVLGRFAVHDIESAVQIRPEDLEALVL
jgi:sialic acid synthase SpsE